MNFNKSQQAFIDKTKGRVLVSASAGSGKTAAMVGRVKKLIAEGVSPKDITVVTFTKNSAEDLVKRIGIEGIRCGTFHGICYRILAMHGIKFHQPRRFEMDNVFRLVVNNPKFHDYPEIYSWIGYQKAYGKTPKSVTFEHKVIKSDYLDVEILKRCFDAYERHNFSHGYMDFEDLIIKAVELLEKKTDEQRLKYQTKYVMVDESMDSNAVQNRLAELLCSTNNLAIVGDVKQSIYQFRGARPEEFASFKADDVIHFSETYRSGTDIVHTANKFARRWFNSAIYKDAEATREEKGKVKIVKSESSEFEAKKVADEIERLISEENVEPKDIAILYRFNKMSELIEIELRERGIPYFIDAETSFFSLKEIKFIVDVLRLCANRDDDMALDELLTTRVYQGLKFVNNAEIMNISSQKTNHLDYGIKHSKKPMNKQGFVNLSAKLKSYKGVKDFTTLVEKIIDDFKVREYVRDNEGYDYEDRKRRKAALDILVYSCYKYDTIQKFLDFVQDGGSPKSKRKGKNEVQLMTVHKSKGLEFKNVFFIGNGVEFPDCDCPIKDEACIFYVAITRAIDYLYVSYVDYETDFIKSIQ